MPMVSARDLSKTYQVAQKDAGLMGTLRHFMHRRYRAIEAVKEVSFDIAAGEIVGFLGPNGAGKTTALKMLTGLVHPTAGEVMVAGHVPQRREHAFLKQITLVMGNKQQLMWDLPASDTLRLNAAVYGIPEGESQRRIAELAGVLGLDQELRQPVRKLSLGQRMKCELVAALMHHPKVLFLDEPTLGLDVNAQANVRAFLRHYNAEHGAAVLLTSHYMADITALCERVVLIHQGRLMYDGKLTELVERFAPWKQVKVEFTTPVEASQLQRYGEVEHREERSASVLVARDHLTAVVGKMLSELPVRDLTVADPPIDDVIGRVFASPDQQEVSRPGRQDRQAEQGK